MEASDPEVPEQLSDTTTPKHPGRFLGKVLSIFNRRHPTYDRPSRSVVADRLAGLALDPRDYTDQPSGEKEVEQ
jgi:hypothetical protein